MLEFLVRNRFGGAAMAVAGIAISLLVLLMSLFFSPPLSFYLAVTGLMFMWVTIVLFISALVIAIIQSAFMPRP